MAAPKLNRSDYVALAMLRRGAAQRTARGWRFGTKRIGDSVVARLVEARLAVVNDNTLALLLDEVAERLTDITVALHHETDKALLVSDDGDRDKAVWLPKSQVEVVHKPGNIMEVTLPEWLAKEKGLI